MLMGSSDVEYQHLGVRVHSGDVDGWFGGEGGGVAGSEGVAVDGCGAANYVNPGVAPCFERMVQSPAGLHLTDQDIRVLMDFEGPPPSGEATRTSLPSFCSSVRLNCW